MANLFKSITIFSLHITKVNLTNQAVRQELLIRLNNFSKKWYFQINKRISEILPQLNVQTIATYPEREAKKELLNMDEL